MLRRICAEYAAAVSGQGYAEARQWPYTYGRLADGTQMTRPLRALYALASDEGVLTASPFEDSGCRRFLAWVGQQQPDAPPGINRALAWAWGTRPDLRATFPDLLGASREPFRKWAKERGVEELGLPPSLLPAAPFEPVTTASAAPALPTATPVPWGVNVIGYFRSELGVGEAGRQTISALDAAGIPLLPLHGDTVPLNRQGHPFTHLSVRDASYPVNLICMNADAVSELAGQAGPSLFADRYSIGLWFWEVTSAPPDGWKRAFELLDEVWVPTRHVGDAVAPVSPIPVVQTTLPIELPPTGPLPRDALSLPDDFMFMFSFDYLSVFKRKNPLALVDAYRRAFPSRDEASLVIKCINQEQDPASHRRLMSAVADRPDIVVVDRYLDPGDKNALTATCDCYVSLHRSEGFGLTMAEAMYLGKPVIATGYSGNLDFMDADNAYLVDYELVEIGTDASPYPPHGVWAEPDVEHAARLMRQVYDDPAESRARGERAAASVRRTHSAGAAAARMAQRLEAVRASHGARLRKGAVRPELPSTVARGPIAPPHSAAGPVGPALRRAVLRVMKPLSAYQKTVNEQLVQSLQGLDHDLGRVEVAQQRSESAGLVHGRRLSIARRDLDILAALHDPVVQRLNDLSSQLQRIESETRALPYMSSDAFGISEDPIAGRVQGYEASDEPSGDVYRSFEDIFRGSEAFIRERQERFLPLVEGHDPVLDFGCGRGEFLDLLRDRGIAHVGVDSDAGMVARAHERGHADVVLGDGIEYLGARAPGELGAIFAAQVIEHLPYETLLRFFALAHRALAPGGVLIAETVNPHAPSALKTFWIDLTHQHPVFPEVALALCRSAGFSRAFVFHPNGIGDIEVDRYATGEYAVVAHVAGASTPAATIAPEREH